jgi:hypothetical protein
MMGEGGVAGDQGLEGRLWPSASVSLSFLLLIIRHLCLIICHFCCFVSGASAGVWRQLESKRERERERESARAKVCV